MDAYKVYKSAGNDDPDTMVLVRLGDLCDTAASASEGENIRNAARACFAEADRKGWIIVAAPPSWIDGGSEGPLVKALRAALAL